MRLEKKTDLLKVFLSRKPLKLLDGAAVVHLFPCTNIVTFDEYADRVFVPYIIKQLQHSKSVQRSNKRKASKGYSEKDCW